MNLEDLAGQKLMIGVSGTRVTREMIEQFRATHAGGVIFFRPNFKSAAAFRKLITDLQEALQRKLLVTVDHEGGRVIHLAEGVTVFPDNLCMGNTGNPQYAAAQGAIEARELTALGINLNLAPAVDVLTARFSPNIGIRSYGSDPKLVSRFAAARIRAMQAGGVAACAKHFPGQGQSPFDAHLDLPVLASSRKEIEKIHLAPFRASIRAGVRTIMSSHPVYPKLDPEKIPATFSRKIIYDLSRRELGFRGVILSDDLEMGALKKFGSPGEIAIRSVRAGHDIILFCRDARAQRGAHAALCRAYRKGELDGRELEESVERIKGLKTKNHRPSSSLETDSLPLEIARRGIREGVILRTRQGIVAGTKDPGSKFFPACPPAGRQGRTGRAPLRMTRGSVFVIFPRLSDLASKIFIEKEMLNEMNFVKSLVRRLSKRGSTVSPFIVGLDPSQQEIQKAIGVSKAARRTIFFCYDAHLLSGCRKLLKGLQRERADLVTVLLRDPYDAEYIGRCGSFVQACGFRACQIQAALERIFKISR